MTFLLSVRDGNELYKVFKLKSNSIILLEQNNYYTIQYKDNGNKQVMTLGHGS